ncbi:hypothetical protein [Streptomyces bambusae]|uniref:Uncharacterized protein n=1 Tax=Streptomyces bambusae TaxID=1550616 RepID=A0ABS6Z4I0_9ACTN|nr:hypothetical protein [Streptomyces bambusae]MBW5482304.1 hypothetical protein [Streptomyces bambusae]
MEDRLSSAIVLYFSDRRGVVKEQGRKLLSATFEASQCAELVSEIEKLVERSFVIGKKFRHLELIAAADSVRGELSQVYPELSKEAVDSLTWYWTFCNR